MTIDTAGLEKTFRDMGESMKEVFTSQQIFNRTMKDTLEASTKAQEKQTEALEKLNISTKQRDHDHMFASIKPYNGKDPKEFDAWIEQIMTACKISGRNPKLVAPSKINRGSNRSNSEHETRSNLGRICRRVAEDVSLIVRQEYMQQQYIMSLEDKMIMRISEVTSTNTPDCIERQQGRLWMRSLTLIINYTSCQG